MTGLLYLPRIFVYHVENFEKKQTTEVFEIMEKRLFNYIMRPAMVLSWLLGIILIIIIGIETFSFLWLQIKFTLVFSLSIYNEYLGKCIKLLKLGENRKSAKFYRIINEIPTVLLIFIVFIVIFKPL
jgi:putative membrane protein|tara:strand:+ start:309 stop:689 length:381 start_codon:yes stop_codon:yes gene_type:complete